MALAKKDALFAEREKRKNLRIAPAEGQQRFSDPVLQLCQVDLFRSLQIAADARERIRTDGMPSDI
jgi:hypothetical protein